MSNIEFETICNVTLVSPELARKNPTVKEFLENDCGRPLNVVSQLVLAGLLKTEFNYTESDCNRI